MTVVIARAFAVVGAGDPERVAEGERQDLVA